MGRTACTEPQCLYKGALYLYLYTTLYNGDLNKLRVSAVYYNHRQASYFRLHKEEII